MYCKNNPVANYDPNGHWVVGAIVGGIFGGLSGALSAANSGGSVIAGLITGAIGGAIIGAVGEALVTVKAVSAIFQVAFGMFSATVAGGVNILNQFINYTNDGREIGTVPPPNSGNPGIEKKPTFTEYIDKKSVFASMGSAALFAPLALGANIAVGAAFKGAGAGSAASAANAIASFYTGGSVSMLQYVAETMLYLFE